MNVLPFSVPTPLQSRWRLQSTKFPLNLAHTHGHPILVLDATNVLCKAAADVRRWNNTLTLSASFQRWTEFLTVAVTPVATVAVFDHPGAAVQRRQNRDQSSSPYLRRRTQRQQPQEQPIPSAAKLTPFLNHVESRGGLAFVAQRGFEADQCIGAVCAELLPHAAAAGRSILIASGDSDMQQYVNDPAVAWLQLLPLPTLSAPQGLALFSKAELQEQLGFNPAAYGEYLAISGKAEASIGGIGVPAGAAAKLLARFGDVDGIGQAARQGLLRSWGPRFSEAFAPESPALKKLRRNQAIFCRPADPAAVLTTAQRDRLSSFSARLGEHLVASGQAEVNAFRENETAEQYLAWRHPLHAGRWRHVEAYARQLAQQLEGRRCEVKVHARTATGLPVDLLLSNEANAEEQIAAMVCWEGDFSPQNEAEAVRASCGVRAKEGLAAALRGEGPGDYCGIGKRLNRVQQHHVKLLRQSGVRCVILVPWWHI